MSGYSELTRMCREITNFLHSKFTPQFMSAVQGAAESVRKMLEDPNLQANFNTTLVQLQEFLKNANQEGLAKKLAGMADDVQALLKLVDVETVKALSNLIKEADNAGLIKNIMNALESIKSLKDLAAVAADLALPAKFFLYGSTGALVGLALTSALQTHLNNKKDEKLLEYMKKLVLSSSLQTSIQIRQYQGDAVDFLVRFDRYHHRNPSYIPSKIESLYKVKCERIANEVIFSNEDNLELIQIANDFCGKMINILYQEELQKESVSDYLDRVNHNLMHWENLVEFTSYYPAVGGKKQKPELLREDLNYYQVKKLYGDKQINAIMKSLVKELSRNGGSHLYSSLINSFEDGSYRLSESFKKIPDQDADLSDDMPWNQSVRTLHTYFHGQAEEFIREQWENTNWNHLPPGKDEMLGRVSLIIRMRALVELCHTTAPYMCFPYNAPREVLNGVLDIPVGAYQFIRHPIDSTYNLGRALFTLEGWVSFATGIYSHPIRLLTSSAVSAGVAGGINSLAHTTTASHATSTALRVTKSLRVTAPTATSSIMNSAGAGATAGTLPAVLAKKEKSSQSELTGVEMTSELGDVVPQMIPGAYPLLMQRLVHVKNIDELHEIYLTWYAEVTISTELNKASGTNVLANIGIFSGSQHRSTSLVSPQELDSTPKMGYGVNSI